MISGTVGISDGPTVGPPLRSIPGSPSFPPAHIEGVEGIANTIEGLDDETLSSEARDELSAMLISAIAEYDLVHGLVKDQIDEPAEIVLTRWLVTVGSRVEADEPMFEISTPAVDTEVPSPTGGVVVQIFAAASSVITKDQILANVLTDNPAAPAFKHLGD